MLKHSKYFTKVVIRSQDPHQKPNVILNLSNAKQNEFQLTFILDKKTHFNEY